jgi:hypothetical protein
LEKCLNLIFAGKPANGQRAQPAEFGHIEPNHNTNLVTYTPF